MSQNNAWGSVGVWAGYASYRFAIILCFAALLPMRIADQQSPLLPIMNADFAVMSGGFCPTPALWHGILRQYALNFMASTQRFSEKHGMRLETMRRSHRDFVYVP